MLVSDTDRKIVGLYIFLTTTTLLLLDVPSVWLENIVIKEVWRAMMQGCSGWFDFVMSVSKYIEILAFILMGYLFVVVLSFRRIEKIPTGEALKNIE